MGRRKESSEDRILKRGKIVASVILYVICSVVGGRDLNELSSLSRKEGNGDHSVSGWVEDK